MDVLLHITAADSLPMALPLARALSRRGVAWGCFLTNDGVRVLDDDAFAAVLSESARAAVCEHSWDHHMASRECPVERGSQTLNSTLMGEAVRVVSL